MSDRNSSRSQKRALQVQKQKEKRSQSSNTLPTNNKLKLLSKKEYSENSQTSEEESNKPHSPCEASSNYLEKLRAFKRTKSMHIQEPNKFILNHPIKDIYTPTVDNDAEQVVSDLEIEVEDNEGSKGGVNSKVESNQSQNLHSLKPLVAAAAKNSSFIPIKNSLQTKKLIKSENSTPSYLLLMEYLNDNNTYTNNKERDNNENENNENTHTSGRHTRNLSHGIDQLRSNKIDISLKFDSDK